MQASIGFGAQSPIATVHTLLSPFGWSLGDWWLVWEFGLASFGGLFTERFRGLIGECSCLGRLGMSQLVTKTEPEDAPRTPSTPEI